MNGSNGSHHQNTKGDKYIYIYIYIQMKEFASKVLAISNLVLSHKKSIVKYVCKCYKHLMKPQSFPSSQRTHA